METNRDPSDLYDDCRPEDFDGIRLDPTRLGGVIVKDETGRTTGTQVVVRYPNGYGASVVSGPYTYGGADGLYEMAVLRFRGDGNGFDLVYDTAVTNDVIGWLTPSDVYAKAAEVEAL